MTEILNLPLLTFSMEIRNNEWWTDAWPYIDAAGNAISLGGLSLVLAVRRRAGDSVLCLGASNDAAVTFGSIPSGRIAVGGAGMNVLALVIPKKSIQKVSPGQYAFEVQAAGNGITRNIAFGSLVVNQGISP